MLSVTQAGNLCVILVSSLSLLPMFASWQIPSALFSCCLRNLMIIVTPSASVAASVLVILLSGPRLCFRDLLLLQSHPGAAARQGLFYLLCPSLLRTFHGFPESFMCDSTLPDLALWTSDIFHPPPSLTLLPQKWPSHFPDPSVYSFKDSHPNSSHLLLCFTPFLNS